MFTLDAENIEALLAIMTGAAALAVLLIVLAVVDLVRLRASGRPSERPAPAGAGSASARRAEVRRHEPEAA